MKKTLLSTLSLLLIAMTVMGQSQKITQFTTTHIHGDGFEGVQNLATTFEIFTDSIVMTFVEPEAVAYFQENNMPTSTYTLGRVQLKEENQYGRVYYLRDQDGEIFLRDYASPSVHLKLVLPQGTEETHFVTFEEKGRI